MKEFTEIKLKENEVMFTGKIDYYSSKWNKWYKSDTIALTWDGNIGRVFRRSKTGQIKEFKTYINKFSSGGKEVAYLVFHLPFTYPNGETKTTVIKFHNALAQIAKLPFYRKGKVADHIDRNTLNNNLDNLQWVTKGQNSKFNWTRLTKEEKLERRKIYSAGVKAGHAKGNYKNHLDKLHEYMRDKLKKPKIEADRTNN